jgi:hypothetical protein
MKHNRLLLPAQDLHDTYSAVELVTPSQARHMRDTMHFERQRDITSARVQRLAQEMQKGRFTPGTQVYVCVLPDGAQIVVNGNHTLEAIHALGEAQVLTITKRAVADINEAGRIYAVFDTHSRRTWRASLRAVGNFDDIPDSGAVLSAIGVIASGFGEPGVVDKPDNTDRLTRLAMLEDYREAVHLRAEALDRGSKNAKSLIRRAGVLAVSLETFRYQPSAAADFWSRVANDEGLVSGDPERALLTWCRAQKGGGTAFIRDHVLAAATAWNLYFKRESRKVLHIRKAGGFRLLGTPHANDLTVSKC